MHIFLVDQMLKSFQLWFLRDRSQPEGDNSKQIVKPVYGLKPKFCMNISLRFKQYRLGDRCS